MTCRTASDRTSRAAPAPPQPDRSRSASWPAVIADPRVRLGAGAAVVLITAMAVRHDRVGPGESMAFRAVNDLPDSLYRPAWLVMQLGALGAAPAAAGAAWLSGDHELAGRLLADGTGTWALAKLVKQLVRPAAAGGAAPRYPLPWQPGHGAGVPVRARRRRRRAGRRRPAASRPDRPCPHPGRCSGRRPDPYLHRRPPATGYRGRRGARACR